MDFKNIPSLTFFGRSQLEIFKKSIKVNRPTYLLYFIYNVFFEFFLDNFRGYYIYIYIYI